MSKNACMTRLLVVGPCRDRVLMGQCEFSLQPFDSDWMDLTWYDDHIWVPMIRFCHLPLSFKRQASRPGSYRYDARAVVVRCCQRGNWAGWMLRQPDHQAVASSRENPKTQRSFCSKVESLATSKIRDGIRWHLQRHERWVMITLTWSQLMDLSWSQLFTSSNCWTVPVVSRHSCAAGCNRGRSWALWACCGAATRKALQSNGNVEEMDFDCVS